LVVFNGFLYTSTLIYLASSSISRILYNLDEDGSSDEDAVDSNPFNLVNASSEDTSYVYDGYSIYEYSRLRWSKIQIKILQKKLFYFIAYLLHIFLVHCEKSGPPIVISKK
jgi:hypothetical protein